MRGPTWRMVPARSTAARTHGGGQYCVSHKSQLRHRGDPALLGPLKAWAKGKCCVVCGVRDWPSNGRRKHCSARCQVLDSNANRGFNTKRHIVCVDCGKVEDISARPGERKIRSDRQYCSHCAGRKTFKLVRGGSSASIGFVRSLGDACAICDGAVDFELRAPHPLVPSIDHITPVALGGTNDLSNIQLAHLRCNQTKHIRRTSADHGRTKRQAFYNTQRWRKLSRQIRSEEPSCRTCGAPAFCVDHITPLSECADPFDRWNLQPLCRRCHNQKSQDEYYARWSGNDAV